MLRTFFMYIKKLFEWYRSYCAAKMKKTATGAV